MESATTVRILVHLQALEDGTLLWRAVLGLGNLTDDHAAHQRVVVALGLFLATDDDWSIDLVALEVLAAGALSLQFLLAVLDDGFQGLELDVGYVIVVVLVEHHGHVPEGRHIGLHGRVGTCIQIEYALVWADEEGADRNGDLCFS